MSTATERSREGAPSQLRRRAFVNEERALIISCPKCASGEARSLESLHRRGAAINVPPPRQRDGSGWVLLSSASALLLLATLTSTPWATAAFGTIAAISGWMAYNAHTYNLRRLPQLRARWSHSVMCASCGEVFLPTVNITA